MCHTWLCISAFVQRGYTVLVESLLFAIIAICGKMILKWIEFRLTVCYLPSFFLLSDSKVDWVGSKDARYDFWHLKPLVTRDILWATIDCCLVWYDKSSTEVKLDKATAGKFQSNLVICEYACTCIY